MPGSSSIMVETWGALPLLSMQGKVAGNHWFLERSNYLFLKLFYHFLIIGSSLATMRLCSLFTSPPHTPSFFLPPHLLFLSKRWLLSTLSFKKIYLFVCTWVWAHHSIHSELRGPLEGVSSLPPLCRAWESESGHHQVLWWWWVPEPLEPPEPPLQSITSDECIVFDSQY